MHFAYAFFLCHRPNEKYKIRKIKINGKKSKKNVETFFKNLWTF